MIFDFSTLDNLDDNKEKWGGKAIELSKLKKQGFSVPNGIVLSSEYYKKYCDHRLIEQDTEPIFSEIISKYLTFNYNNLIFRSSANVEGSTDSDFCGIFDSHIYDKNLSIFKNVAKVWDSTFTPTVKAYQAKQIHSQEIAMAVLIQPIIYGRYSAVVQSFDLINNANRIIIEYSCNGFDMVVNGEENSYLAYINPQTMKVDYYEADSPILCNRVIESIIYDCKKIEQLFNSHVELEIQLFNDTIKYIQVRKVR